MPVRVPTVDDRDEASARRPIYADVEELITPGFVSYQAAVGSVNLSIRSLTPGDFVLLRHRVGVTATARSWKEWAVASSVWMVDGQCLIGDVNAAARVRASLETLPSPALDALFSLYTSIHNRVHQALQKIEAFCYEEFSRASWRMFNRANPAREDVAGIPGISGLGMNHVQRLWVAYNLAEDDRQAWHQEWAAAKLTASAASPKGVRKLNQRDESERKLEAEQRRRIIAKVYYEATGRHYGEAGGMVVHRAVTAEELVDEMDRWMRGEKDWHDQVIDAYKEKIREKHEADRTRHEARMRELDVLRAEVGAAGGATLVGHTIEQLREIRGQGGDGLVRRGTPVAPPSAPGRVYEKFVARDIPVGGFSERGAVARPLGDEGGEGGLADAVRSRQVQLSDVAPRPKGGA